MINFLMPCLISVFFFFKSLFPISDFLQTLVYFLLQKYLWKHVIQLCLHSPSVIMLFKISIWSHVVNWSLKYGGVVSWFTFFSCVWHFLSTSTRPSKLNLVSICSLISLLWNEKRSQVIRIYNKKVTAQSIQVCTGGAGDWGAHRVTHK